MPLPAAPSLRLWRLALPLSLLTVALGACAMPGGGGAGPGAGVGTGADTAALRGTAWAWVPLQGALPAPAAPGPRVAQLQLDTQEARVAGHTGCNRLNAGFTLQGSALRFGQAATTRMACLDPQNSEAAFLAAFEATRAWRIQGRVLHLLGEDGQPVMRLQAAP
jgi:heat shock protein HslJ